MTIVHYQSLGVASTAPDAIQSAVHARGLVKRRSPGRKVPRPRGTAGVPTVSAGSVPIAP